MLGMHPPARASWEASVWRRLVDFVRARFYSECTCSVPACFLGSTRAAHTRCLRVRPPVFKHWLLSPGVLPRKHARGTHSLTLRAPAFIQNVLAQSRRAS